MKVIVLIFSVVFLIVSEINAQDLNNDELINTEWFVDNSDSIFEMYTINLDVDDSLVFIKRLNTNVKSDSAIFGAQEVAVLGHHYYYANFEFQPNSSLLYFLTSKDFSFHTIVGQMPLWKWKLKGRNKVKLYQNGVLKLTLELVKNEIHYFQLDGDKVKGEKLVFVRIK